MNNHASAHRVWCFFYIRGVDERKQRERARRSAAETDALNFGPPAEDDAYADWHPEGSTAAVLGGLGWLAGIIAALGLLGFVFIKAVNIMLPLADGVLKNAR